MRLIDADALMPNAEYKGRYDVVTAYDIANAPTVGTKRTGHWELCGNHHLCSECDEWALTKWNEDECDEVDVLTDFCPSCGADMRGEQE